MDKEFEYLIVPTNKRVGTLKEVRGELGISGRAIKHAFSDGRLKKININQYVNNDEEAVQERD